jgi:hypothetical protein
VRLNVCPAVRSKKKIRIRKMKMKKTIKTIRFQTTTDAKIKRGVHHVMRRCLNS